MGGWDDSQGSCIEVGSSFLTVEKRPFDHTEFLLLTPRPVPTMKCACMKA